MAVLNIGVSFVLEQNVQHLLCELPKHTADDVDGPHLQIIYWHIWLDYLACEQLIEPLKILSLNFLKQERPLFLLHLPHKFYLMLVLRALQVLVQVVVYMHFSILHKIEGILLVIRIRIVLQIFRPFETILNLL